MAKIQYVDFDIRIERRKNGYRAQVLDSPAGEAETDFQLPLLDTELDSLVRRMGHIRGGIRRTESPEIEAARMIGTKLFGSVFSNNVRTCFENARTSLPEGTGLRLRLRLSEVPELADIPWEFLYDTGTDRFLALSIETPLVRYIDLPQVAQPLSVQPPLDILAMISCPSDYQAIDGEREWKKLKQALSDIEQRGLVRLHRSETATLNGLHHQLRQRHYHIFHFIGHGLFQKSTQDGFLVFEDETRLGRPVTGQELGTLFYDYRSSLRLAMLNACEGARTSRTDPFAGAAQSLIQKGIPAVIAMQFEITDEAAITLTHEFYCALAEGYPVDAALSEARKSIFAQSTEIGSNIEWGTPVLYMRSPDGNIFDIAQPVASIPVVPGVSDEQMKSNRIWTSFRDVAQKYWIQLIVAIILAGAVILGLTCKPVAWITSLQNNDHVDQFITLMGGYSARAEKLPLWIFVQDPGGMVYPQSMHPCTGEGTPKKDGLWEMTMGVGINTSQGDFHIILTTTDEKTDHFISSTLETQCQNKNFSSFGTIPSGATIIQNMIVRRTIINPGEDPYGPAPELANAKIPGNITVAPIGINGIVNLQETVKGTSSGINAHIWVLVHTYYGLWYPQSKDPCFNSHTQIDPKTGQWQVKTIFGGVGDEDKGKPYDVAVVLANDDTDKFFAAKQVEWCGQNHYPGFLTIELPRDIKEMNVQRYYRQ